jgi:predicted transcriptional regulator
MDAFLRTERTCKLFRPNARPSIRGNATQTGVTLSWAAATSYTKGMKTAISIPDDLFEGAERLARRTKKSRSRLFRDALKEYLARHSPDQVTEAMDNALAQIDGADDGFVSVAAQRILERSEW